MTFIYLLIADIGGLLSNTGHNNFLKNGRDNELEGDDLGVLFMIRFGYSPEEMIGVMKILKAAAGTNRLPGFKSTHPDPDNRIEIIQKAIEKYKTKKALKFKAFFYE